MKKATIWTGKQEIIMSYTSLKNRLHKSKTPLRF